MSNANGTPDTASESGSGTMLSGTAARLTQYPALGPHTMARLIESRATASTMSSGWSAFGSAFKKLPNPTRPTDRKSTRLNSSHLVISYAVFCLKKKKKNHTHPCTNESHPDTGYHQRHKHQEH